MGNIRRLAGAIAACAMMSPIVNGRVLAQQHDHTRMNMTSSAGWQLMQDGSILVEFNHQGSPRGGQEFVAPNWWMLMADRRTSRGTLTLSGMFSLDPATVGGAGYREIFQAGETYRGQPIVDRQHPHDFFMQAGAAWTMTLPRSFALTVAGAAVGSPALGPVAFMHRTSAMDNPMAPLGHHTFDSTHISYGVVTAGVSRGRWTAEASVFNAREPDEHRWDFDFAPLDSLSGRLWFKPNSEWAIQVSSGRLVRPEQLEPGNIERTTASATWTRQPQANAGRTTSFTAGYGRNDTDHGARQAFFAEGAHRTGLNTVFGRFERLQLESSATGTPLSAFTFGGVRDILNRAAFRGGFGAGVTFYATPDTLQEAYGAHPVSFQIFFRIRRGSGPMNMPNTPHTQ